MAGEDESYENWMWKYGVDFSVLGQTTAACCYENGNGPSGYIKGEEYLDHQSVLLEPEEGLFHADS